MIKKISIFLIFTLLILCMTSCGFTPQQGNNNSNNNDQTPDINDSADDNKNDGDDKTPVSDDQTPDNNDKHEEIPVFNLDNYQVYFGAENIDNETLQAQKIIEGDSSKTPNKSYKKQKQFAQRNITNDFFRYDKDEFIFDEIRNKELGGALADVYALLEINILTNNADDSIAKKYYYLNSDKATGMQQHVYFDFLNENTFVVSWYVFDLLNSRDKSIVTYIISIDENNPFLFYLDTNSKELDEWFIFSYMDKTGVISSVPRKGEWKEEIDELINYVAYENKNALLPFAYLKKEIVDKNRNLDFFTNYEINYMLRDYIDTCDNLYLLPSNLSQIFMSTFSEPELNLVEIVDNTVVNIHNYGLIKTVVVPTGVTKIELSDYSSDPDDMKYAPYYGWYIPDTVTEITEDAFKEVALSAVFLDSESISEEMEYAIRKYNPNCEIYYKNQWRISCGVYVPNERYLSLLTENSKILELFDKLSSIEQFKLLLSYSDYANICKIKRSIASQLLKEDSAVKENDEVINNLIKLAISKIQENDYDIKYSENYKDLIISCEKNYLDASYGLIVKETNNHCEIVGSNGLSDVVIPATYNGKPVTVIQEKAFYRDNKITSIIIPNSITKIGEDAFDLSFNLKTINYQGTFTDWFMINFENERSNPMCSASKFLLKGEEIVEVVLDDSITEISNQLSGFNMKKIVIPDGIKLNDGAFSYCVNLEEIVLPSDIAAIPNMLFLNCYSLKEINIPNSVITIGSQAFNGCASLKEIKLPENVVSIGWGAFALCFKLERISLPDSIECINRSTFICCKSLKEVEFSNNLKEINSDAFSFCSSLKTVTIPNSVTFIGENAFSSCNSMEYLIIPSSVEYIERNVFAGSSIKDIFVSLSIDDTNSWDSQWADTLMEDYDAENEQWVAYKNNVYYLDEWKIIDGIPTIK